MKRNSLVLAVILAGVAVMILAGRFLRPSVPSVGDLRGKPAPDFELKSLEGGTVKLADYRGKAVLLNFWATWCAPCKIETPWIIDLQKRYADKGLQVLGVAMDDSDDDIKKFKQDMGMNYPVLLGTEAVGGKYGGLNYLPTTYFIDREGKVTARVYGLKSRSEMEDNVKVALGAARAAR